MARTKQTAKAPKKKVQKDDFKTKFDKAEHHAVDYVTKRCADFKTHFTQVCDQLAKLTKNNFTNKHPKHKEDDAELVNDKNRTCDEEVAAARQLVRVQGSHGCANFFKNFEKELLNQITLARHLVYKENSPVDKLKDLEAQITASCASILKNLDEELSAAVREIKVYTTKVRELDELHQDLTDEDIAKVKEFWHDFSKKNTIIELFAAHHFNQILRSLQAQVTRRKAQGIRELANTAKKQKLESTVDLSSSIIEAAQHATVATLQFNEEASLNNQHHHYLFPTDIMVQIVSFLTFEEGLQIRTLSKYFSSIFHMCLKDCWLSPCTILMECGNVKKDEYLFQWVPRLYLWLLYEPEILQEEDCKKIKEALRKEYATFNAQFYACEAYKSKSVRQKNKNFVCAQAFEKLVGIVPAQIILKRIKFIVKEWNRDDKDQVPWYRNFHSEISRLLFVKMNNREHTFFASHVDAILLQSYRSTGFLTMLEKDITNFSNKKISIPFPPVFTLDHMNSLPSCFALSELHILEFGTTWEAFFPVNNNCKVFHYIITDTNAIKLNSIVQKIKQNTLLSIAQLCSYQENIDMEEDDSDSDDDFKNLEQLSYRAPSKSGFSSYEELTVKQVVEYWQKKYYRRQKVEFRLLPEFKRSKHKTMLNTFYAYVKENKFQLFE